MEDYAEKKAVAERIREAAKKHLLDLRDEFNGDMPNIMSVMTVMIGVAFGNLPADLQARGFRVLEEGVGMLTRAIASKNKDHTIN